MRVAHLLIPVAVLLPALLLAIWLLKLWGLDELARGHPSAPLAGLVLLSLGLVLWFLGLPLYWPICRLFGILPLFIFAPPCPHCARKPPGWWCVERHAPAKRRTAERVVLACGLCEGKVELWLQRNTAAGANAALPTYCLRWPEFLGIWRRLPEKTGTDRVVA